MFNENLKSLRKSKGISQEELASRLNVVRQTISKWEKGLSVPDAEILIRISDLFEVPVNELLGTKIENSTNTNLVAEQLARLNEQLAIKNRRSRRILKIVFGIFIAFVVFNVFLIILNITGTNKYNDPKSSKTGVTQSETVVNE